MVKQTKAQRKDRERIEAWLEQKPFKENARDKDPQIPNLTREEVLELYVPRNISDGAQFYTPLEMAEAFWVLVTSGYVNLKSGMRILEPCAGIGNLLAPIAGDIERMEIDVEAFEIDAEAYQVGEKLFPTWIWWNDTPFSDYKVPRLENLFDLVVMNPPLRIQWSNDINSEWIESGATNSEHRFLELAVRALKPGGQAMIIAPYNYFDRLPKGKGVKDWFAENAKVTAEFGKLPGEFQFTGIQAFGWLIERISIPDNYHMVVDWRASEKGDRSVVYVPDDYEPEEELPEEDVIEMHAEFEAEIEKEHNLTKEEVEGVSEPEQLEISFLPPAPPEPIFEGDIMMSVLELNFKDLKFGKAPDAAFLQSVETWGIRDPILLTQDGEGKNYKLRDGRRRLQAAIKLEMEFIPSKVYSLESISGIALTLDSNVQRSSNPVAEYEAIVAFMDEAKAKGVTVTERDISQATGMKIQTIRKRMKLAQVPNEIIDAVADRKVALGVAEGIARLNETEKGALLDKFREEGKITGNDLREVRQVKINKATGEIPSEVFDMPAFDPVHRHNFEIVGMAEDGYRCSCGREISVEQVKRALNAFID